MSVYIKNITKDDLSENGALMWGKRIILIPPEDIIPVPDHGRLIDANSISEKIDNIWDGRPLSMLGCKILAMIDKEPTVIPAERE